MIENNSCAVPNHDYIELVVCARNATYKTSSGKNSTAVMQRISPDMFLLTEGDTGRRWNNKAKKKRLPMSDWDACFARMMSQGWTVYATEPRKKKVYEDHSMSLAGGKIYAPIKDASANLIVKRLLSSANKMISENYQKNILDVPDWAFEEAKKLLDELATECEYISNDSFNEKLLRVFTVLPRRIDVMSKYIASDTATAEDRAKIIETERERYDVLHSVLRGAKSVNLTGKETILDVYGIEIRAFTDKETEFVKEKLDRQQYRLLNGWRVINHRTEDLFQRFCADENLSEHHGIDFLFHGSKHENWWSILTKGLTINPIGVVTTGKSYGLGTYFAPDAIKSLGYTSARGAKWTSGGQPTGFMAIYKVATGNRYDGSQGCDHQLTWDKLQKIQPGAHCTWAECRYSGFQMDEVIVYKDEQSTVWGLMELSM